MNTRPIGRLDWLLHPSRATAASLLLALAMAIPALRLGFFADDYLQTLSIEGAFPSNNSRFDLYHFTPDGPDAVLASIARGELPWWTRKELRLHFFRPLSSALLSLDHALFHRATLGYHVHGLLWYLALVGAAGLVFRRALPGATGAAALLLFAIDDCHASPVDWIACRHMLVSATPAVLGLAAHLRYREDGWKPGRWLSFAGVGVGLLGGETALGAIAYWIAYELAGPTGAAGSPASTSTSVRLARVAPVLGFSAVYLVFYKALGYGARGNDLYVEPFADPRAFVIALAARVPILLGNLLSGLPSDLTMALPAGPFLAFGVASALGFFLLYRAALPFVPEVERRALRWLVPGALLALVAAAGGVTGARLLLMPSLGGAALVATLLRFGLRGVGAGGTTAARWARRAGWGAVALVHVVFSPVLFAMSPYFLDQIATRIETIAREAEVGPGPGQQVFVLAASDPMAALYSGLVRFQEDPGRMAGWQPLSMARYPHRVIRTGPSSFRLQVVGGRLMDGGFERLYRSARVPFAIGEEVAVGGARVVVRALGTGRETDGETGRARAPTEIEVRFDRPLEDPGLSLLAWQGGRLRRVTMPEVGGSVELPWEAGPTGVF